MWLFYPLFFRVSNSFLENFAVAYRSLQNFGYPRKSSSSTRFPRPISMSRLVCLISFQVLL